MSVKWLKNKGTEGQIDLPPAKSVDEVESAAIAPTTQRYVQPSIISEGERIN
jgi:hypothetical protein